MLPGRVFNPGKPWEQRVKTLREHGETWGNMGSLSLMLLEVRKNLGTGGFKTMKLNCLIVQRYIT